MAEQQKAQLAFPRTLSLAQQCFPVALPWVPNPLVFTLYLPCIYKEYRLLWNSACHGPETPSTHAFLLLSSPQRFLKGLGLDVALRKHIPLGKKEQREINCHRKDLDLSLKTILRRKSIAELNHGCSYPEKKKKELKNSGLFFNGLLGHFRCGSS